MTKTADGTLLSHHACATEHQSDRTTLEDMSRAGRARWTIDNAHTHLLKTTGYHLEHNYGHGQPHLSAVLLTLNRLAFLCHTVLGWGDPKYPLVRQALSARQTFFQDLQAFTRALVCDSWDRLLDFMIQGLELVLPPDSS